MQEKVCESSYYDEKDPDIQFLKGILNQIEDSDDTDEKEGINVDAKSKS